MTEDEYRIWLASRAVHLGLQTFAREQAILEQEQAERQARIIRAEVKAFVRRSVMWFFILLALLIFVLCIL